MAKPNTKDAPKGAAEPTNEATTTADATEAPQASTYPKGQDLANIVASKQAHGALGKAWKMKGGTTEIPQRFDKAEVAQYEPKVGATKEETMDNLLAFCAGTEQEKLQAIVDTFGAAHRLAAQKQAKDEMGEASTDVAVVQDIVNGYLSGSKRRGAGGVKAGAAKARAEKAEAKAAASQQTANDILAELEAINPEAAKKYRERLVSLGQ